MNSRIELDETIALATLATGAVTKPPPPFGRELANADWESAKNEPLMLYLSDEPAIGHEFSYNGVRWQIIDYRDGWVARLLV